MSAPNAFSRWRSFISPPVPVNSTECVCDPEFQNGLRFVQWIGSYFGDCVYSTQDFFSWAFGMLSLATFLLVFLPQIQLNYKRQSVDGLSVGLLAFWTLGDVSGLLGVVWTNQLAPQFAVAVYFLATDLIIVLQWWDYGML